MFLFILNFHFHTLYIESIIYQYQQVENVLGYKQNKKKTIYTLYYFDRVRLLNHPKRLCSVARRFNPYPVLVNNLSI